MKRRVCAWFVWVRTFILATAILAIPATAFGGTQFSVVTLASGAWAQNCPSVSQDRVFWQEMTWTRYDIVSWYSGASTFLTALNGDQCNARSDGSRVIYQSVGWDPTVGNMPLPGVYVYDYSTQRTERVGGVGEWPDVSGDWAVWCVSDATTGLNIFATNIVTGEGRVICAARGDQEMPRISGNRVVWTDYRVGSAPAIYMYDLRVGQELYIGSGTKPDIDGNTIVWRHAGSTQALQTLDLGSWIRRDFAAGAMGDPQVSGNRVVYTARSQVPQIRMYDLKADKDYVVDSSAVMPDHLGISGNRIVWADYSMDPNGDVKSAAIEETHSLVYLAASGGSISGATSQTVNYGASGTTVVAVPLAGFHFLGWSDGVRTATRRDTSVVVDKTVTAYFSDRYTIAYIAGPGGGMSGNATQSVLAGTMSTQVTAVPSIGYRFMSWSDGVTTPARADLLTSSDTTVTASFAALPKATVSTPIAPRTMYRGRSATIYGYVSPKHSSGTYLATLRFYLKNSAGTYVYHHSVRAKRYYYSSSRTEYKAITSLPHRGRWRVRAYHSCAAHSGIYSGYDYITVR